MEVVSLCYTDRSDRRMVAGVVARSGGWPQLGAAGTLKQLSSGPAPYRMPSVLFDYFMHIEGFWIPTAHYAHQTQQ